MKAQMRQHYKSLRRDISADKREELSLGIANKSLEIESLWKYEYYHIFLPIKHLNEINTEYLLHILQGKDKQVIISKSDFETLNMAHYLMTDATKIKVSNFGIPEPVKGVPVAPSFIEVVFIPLLAFDQRGNRIGYGKGFYDKFLSTCASKTLKVGLSYFEPETLISAEEHDQKLDLCITPSKIYNF